MKRKITFYLVGFLPGLLFLFLIFNKKGASCSGYLPNSRVIMESLSKEIQYSPPAMLELKKLSLSPEKFQNEIFKEGEIDFKNSKIQNEKCPQYLMKSVYNQRDISIVFRKCDKITQFISIQ